MGMAASQVSFLALTSRKADIIGQEQKLSQEKMALTRDMRKVTQDYHAGLNQKIYKWSNNGGASYVDLSYKNLMTPSTLNFSDAYLVTDLNDKVVLDSRYKKYAEMISPNGMSGASWGGSTRANIIAELANLDATKIASMEGYSNAVDKNHQSLDEIVGKAPEMPRTVEKKGTESLLKKLESNPMLSWMISIYENEGSIESVTSEALGITINNIQNGLSKYFPGHESEFENACAKVADEYCQKIDSNDDCTKSGGFLKGSASQGYSVNFRGLVDYIIDCYIARTGECTDPAFGESQVVWYNVDDQAYIDWCNDYDEWERNKEQAENNYDQAVENNATLFTSAEETLIAFYDQLFSAVAEKGWTYNEQVNDADYLNQMLQNNLFTITTVEREAQYDDYSKETTYKNDYETNIAGNLSYVYEVSDSDAREEAQVEYEYKKSIINQKETRIDTRMADLSTELSAINQELKSREQVKNENIERTFSAMG